MGDSTCLDLSPATREAGRGDLDAAGEGLFPRWWFGSRAARLSGRLGRQQSPRHAGAGARVIVWGPSETRMRRWGSGGAGRSPRSLGGKTGGTIHGLVFGAVPRGNLSWLILVLLMLVLIVVVVLSSLL